MRLSWRKFLNLQKFIDKSETCKNLSIEICPYIFSGLWSSCDFNFFFLGYVIILVAQRCHRRRICEVFRTKYFCITKCRKSIIRSGPFKIGEHLCNIGHLWWLDITNITKLLYVIYFKIGVCNLYISVQISLINKYHFNGLTSLTIFFFVVLIIKFKVGVCVKLVGDLKILLF